MAHSSLKPCAGAIVCATGVGGPASVGHHLPLAHMVGSASITTRAGLAAVHRSQRA